MRPLRAAERPAPSATKSASAQPPRATADHRGVKAVGQIFKLACSMAFFAAGATAGGFAAAVLWTMSVGFFLLALGY